MDIFYKNILNIKFRENPSSESRVVPGGQTELLTLRGKVNGRFSQYYERSLKPEILTA